MKKSVIIFCLLVFIVQLVQIIYFERGVFSAKYDSEYWKDRYEHSQYELPLSKRTVGDDGLHAYAGYKLINGANPFSINIDKPPAGKYLLGLSILIFQNPLYVVLFLGFCTLIVFYFISRHFFASSGIALFTTTLLFLDPLFFSQFWIAALDLMQLFFLLLNILLVINIRKLRRWNILVILGSGLSLGIFAEVKPPILLPIIFILETAFFLYKGLRREYLLFIFGFLLGIFIPYVRFIFLGNGLIDILKVHKFMASIYLQSQLKANMGAIWLTLLTGRFPNVITGSLMNVLEWWVIWPVIALSGIITAIFSFFSKSIAIFNKGLAVFLLASLVVFTFIPSYPRYLVIVLPFLYLFGVGFLRKLFLKKRSALYLTLLAFGVVNSFFFLLPKPESSLNGFYYNLSHLYFHDIYQENVTDTSSLGLTRDQFRHVVNKALEDAGVRKIEIAELSRDISPFASEGSVKVGVTYKTQDLGSFYEEKIVKLIQKDGKWRVVWDWSLVFNGFSPDFVVQTEITLGKRGSIIDSERGILAQDYENYLISVNPEEMDLRRENEMLNFVSLIGGVKAPHLQNAYLENSLPGSYVPLVTLFYPLDQITKTKLLSFPGIKLTAYPSRVYYGADSTIRNTFYEECCTKLYSSYNYHGVKGVEEKYDNDLWGYSGGRILMRDNKDVIIKVIFEKSKQDGKDVVL